MYKKVSFALLVSSLLALHSSAQSVTSDEKSIQSLLYKNAASLHFSTDDLKNSRISSFYYDEASKATMVYLQQTYKGVDVYSYVTPVALRNDKVITANTSRLAVEDLIAGKSEKPAVAAVAALRAAVAQLNLPLQQALIAQSISADKHQFVFNGSGISYNNIHVELLWFPVENDTKYQLAWQVNIQLAKNNENWMIHIDAQNGSLLKKENLATNDLANVHVDPSRHYDTKVTKMEGVESVEAVSSGSYKVIPYPAEDPNHASPTLVSNPWDMFGTGNLATTLKWNSDGSKDYDSTQGNNVYAQPDLDGKQGTYSGAARSTTALPNLTFNFTPDFNVDPLKSSSNINFATTNLFYWNNLMHDASYQYGFTEAAGNFQTNNLSRGGKGADYVIADAMDASGTNNANFSTPVDGSKPRMQMYLWSPSALKIKVLKVNSPSSYAGFKMSTEGAVSTKNLLKNVGPVTANVVLFKDKGNLTSYSACVASGNAAALKGKIAYIDRGNCNFTDKILKAQNAGAVGVILGDNVDASIPPAMGGTNNKIIIPAVSIRKVDADSLKSFLVANTVVNATLQADTSAPQLDGDVDNGIISHEYTHGISGRLTGGPSKTCLTNKEAMNEGWSDYVALMMTTNWATATVNDGPIPRPIGNYAFGLPTTGAGIRNYPYSTDKSVNPWTFDSLSNSAILSAGETHNVGELWCVMLWDMTWKLVGSNGINTNFLSANSTGGNSVAMKLMIQGLKLQPCAPGFVSGRDAILKADTLLFSGQYSADVWRAFANRGCGYSAKEGKTSSVKDDTAAYDLPPSVNNITASVKTPALASVATAKVSVSPNPAKDVVNINVAGNTKSLQVVLYTNGGQVVSAHVMTGATKTIKVNGLASGTYYISITGEGISQKEKIVIQ